jgi:hypothetical protein
VRNSPPVGKSLEDSDKSIARIKKEKRSHIATVCCGQSGNVWKNVPLVDQSSERRTTRGESLVIGPEKGDEVDAPPSRGGDAKPRGENA